MSKLFQPPPPPKSALGVYRQLSPNAGIHVSPLQLGAMSIGDKWNEIMGSMDKEGSFKLLDAFYERGGNFIDTSNNYQMEASEMFLGEWMESRGIRDQIVIATKYTTNFKMGNEDIAQQTLYVGNNKKSLHLSVNASLKKLRTDYIDILYVHWWDWATSVKEVMDGLHTLVEQGKVLYLGVSDTPAWIVSQANEYAKSHGKTPFIIYQGAWSILQRDFEREIIPMARAHGMALAPWNVLAAGKLRSNAEEKKRQESGEGGRTMFGDWKKDEKEQKIVDALEKVAKELGDNVDTTAVAIAYVMQKTPYVFPIIGGRKVEHLDNNIKALELHLSDEQIKFLEGVHPFDVGFPASMVGTGDDYNFLYKTVANYAPKPVTVPVGHK